MAKIGGSRFKCQLKHQGRRSGEMDDVTTLGCRLSGMKTVYTLHISVGPDSFLLLPPQNKNVKQYFTIFLVHFLANSYHRHSAIIYKPLFCELYSSYLVEITGYLSAGFSDAVTWHATVFNVARHRGHLLKRKHGRGNDESKPSSA
jgi:hypothetical protein